MKTIRMFLILAIAALSSSSLFAQDYTYMVMSRDGYRYEGEWPSGYGVLYSYQDGLVIGDFHKGKPHGKCVCYKPNGEVYWGDFKKGKATVTGDTVGDPFKDTSGPSLNILIKLMSMVSIVMAMLTVAIH